MKLTSDYVSYDIFIIIIFIVFMIVQTSRLKLATFHFCIIHVSNTIVYPTYLNKFKN